MTDASWLYILCVDFLVILKNTTLFYSLVHISGSKLRTPFLITIHTKNLMSYSKLEMMTKVCVLYTLYLKLSALNYFNLHRKFRNTLTWYVNIQYNMRCANIQFNVNWLINLYGQTLMWPPIKLGQSILFDLLLPFILINANTLACPPVYKFSSLCSYSIRRVYVPMYVYAYLWFTESFDIGFGFMCFF